MARIASDRPPAACTRLPNPCFAGSMTCSSFCDELAYSKASSSTESLRPSPDTLLVIRATPAARLPHRKRRSTLASLPIGMKLMASMAQPVTLWW